MIDLIFNKTFDNDYKLDISELGSKKMSHIQINRYIMKNMIGKQKLNKHLMVVFAEKINKPGLGLPRPFF